MQGRIIKVSGPLIVAGGMADVQMYDVVRVSEKHLIGEVIELRGDQASIQVYEETGGIGPGEPVETTGAPLSVELAPGLIESIYDGIQRPLNLIRERAGDRITRGIMVDALDHEKLWAFTPVAKVGDLVTGGDILGTVQETEAVLHRVMVPPNVSGELVWLFEGEANIVTPIARIEAGGQDSYIIEVPMLQKWPVRKGRPYAEKISPREPMITVSASSIRCFRSRRVARQPFPARLAAARRSFNISSQNGRMRISSSTSAAANAATR